MPTTNINSRDDLLRQLKKLQENLSPEQQSARAFQLVYTYYDNHPRTRWPDSIMVPTDQNRLFHEAIEKSWNVVHMEYLSNCCLTIALPFFIISVAAMNPALFLIATALLITALLIITYTQAYKYYHSFSDRERSIFGFFSSRFNHSAKEAIKLAPINQAQP